MAANTAARQGHPTISLRALCRPKNNDASKESPPKKPSRWLPKLDQTYSSNRIQKPLAAKSSYHLDDTLPSRFSGYIDQNQKELASHADTELNKVEDSLYRKLDSVMEETEKNLMLVERKEREQLRSIAEEQLQITSMSTSGEKTEVVVYLEERMTEFEEIINRHAKALDHLWAEWQAVQDNIVMLWAQELGPKAFPVIETQAPQALRNIINAGTGLWRQEDAERQSIIDEAQALQKSIEKIANETSKTVEEQEKVWSTAFQRKLQDILDNLKMIS